MRSDFLIASAKWHYTELAAYRNNEVLGLRTSASLLDRAGTDDTSIPISAEP
jgi:hypothetical protein